MSAARTRRFRSPESSRSSFRKIELTWRSTARVVIPRSRAIALFDSAAASSEQHFALANGQPVKRDVARLPRRAEKRPDGSRIDHRASGGDLSDRASQLGRVADPVPQHEPAPGDVAVEERHRLRRIAGVAEHEDPERGALSPEVVDDGDRAPVSVGRAGEVDRRDDDVRLLGLGRLPQGGDARADRDHLDVRNRFDRADEPFPGQIVGLADDDADRRAHVTCATGSPVARRGASSDRDESGS